MKKEELLNYCKYYKGADEKPTDISSIWHIEERWVKLCSNVIDRVHDLNGDELELLSDELELYTRRVYYSFPNIHDISKLPPSLLGLLWTECVHQGELEFGPSDGAGIDEPDENSPVSSSISSVKEMFLRAVKKYYG